MKNNPIFYRLSQIMSLLLGARIFLLLLFTFTLYVSTFFLFNQEENLRKFVFDYKKYKYKYDKQKGFTYFSVKQTEYEKKRSDEDIHSDSLL